MPTRSSSRAGSRTSDSQPRAKKTRAAATAAQDGVAALEPSLVREIYRQLDLARQFNDIQVEYFRGGHIPGGLHPGTGHEAIAVGVTHATRATDLINGTHRSNNAMMICRGVHPVRIWAEMLGKETGVNRGRRGVDLMGSFDDDVRVWPQNPVLGHNPGISTGAALGYQLRGSDDVVVCLMGDGASVAGTVWESCFFAGVRKLPIVFCVENNLVAYSTPYEKMTPTENVSDRAVAFGFPGKLVDGNDVLAVRDEVGAAVDRARSGSGPTLLELRTYRFVGHFIGDPEVYRTREEVRKARENDPVVRFRESALAAGRLTESDITELAAANEELLRSSWAQALEEPDPDPSKCLAETYQSGVYPAGYSS
jgi:TPP-dependent pyruvate/acetoin dehydrogenase alpha subunit